MCMYVCVCVFQKVNFYECITKSFIFYLKGARFDSSISSKDFFWSNATTCPCGLRCPPSWAWQQCNRLLRLGRP